MDYLFFGPLIRVHGVLWCDVVWCGVERRGGEEERTGVVCEREWYERTVNWWESTCEIDTCVSLGTFLFFSLKRRT